MFKKYRRTTTTEMQPWEPVGFESHEEELAYLLQHGVSVSKADIDNKSPKNGDMLAKNPADKNDLWLVAAEYFEANFELE